MVVNFNAFIFRYGVMTRCWNLNPDFRPPFENLRQRMDTYLREEVCNIGVNRIHSSSEATETLMTLLADTHLSVSRM